MICYNILYQQYTILKENDGYYFRKGENETVAENIQKVYFCITGIAICEAMY